MKTNISLKIIFILAIGIVCFIASLLVLGLVDERQSRFTSAKSEIADSWGKRQNILGPMLIQKNVAQNIDTYILPDTLQYETLLEPEVRSRGIFNSVVYTSKIKVSGEFSRNAVAGAISQGARTAIFSVAITDTKGIEKQFDLTWNGNIYTFNPSPGVAFQESSGLHAVVPININSTNIPFSFELQLKGSEGISIAPLGKETSINISSSWASPKFVGAFLPSEKEISASGFSSLWRISSFGRSYPQTWQSGDISLQQLVDSSAGVDLHEEIDTYDMIFRSVKYAILFIVITFATFFLFDILSKVRIHPIQYLLVGSALSLFYLLLLSFGEYLGFFYAYLIATGMVALLITFYSAFVLKSKQRAIIIFVLLGILYGYLYFVLQLEDYALLFGSLLLFVLLTVIMFSTRNLDWFNSEKKI